MKKLLLLAATVCAVCSCDFSNLLGRFVKGDGVSVDITCEVGEFAAISSVGSIDVFYTQTPGAQSVTLTCDQNLAEYYQVEVERGILFVSVKPGYFLSPKAKSFLTVSSPALNGISITGSGDCFVSGQVVTDGDLILKLSGSGSLDIDGSASCKALECKLTGSGDARIKEAVSESAVLSTMGSGDISVNSISAGTISFSSTGSGDGVLGCKDAGDINVRLTGSGSVTLTGNARSLEQKVNGSGRVNAGGLALSGR